ncbi:putative isomerase YbhE [Xylariaceae sp. FL0016]|nr:putative isomerase YbhE [Xylariaceae sp. FL0016]
MALQLRPARSIDDPLPRQKRPRCYVSSSARSIGPRGPRSRLTLVVTFVLLGVLFLTSHLAQALRDTIPDHLAMWKDALPAALAATSLVGSVSASDALLYVSSYAGTITTLKLSLPDGDAAAAATLESISISEGGCGVNPSWLTLDYSKNLLFCTDEGLNEKTGSLASLSINPNGSLTSLAKLEVILGPVSLAQYGTDGDGLAAAHYSGSSVSAVAVTPEGDLQLVQNETYVLDQPGPDPSRQEAPHPHEALLDPTGAFILVPDLGADLVRVYQADASDLALTPVAPLVAAPGSGPRHGVFKVVGDKTWFYLVSELANTITGYEVTYHANKTLSFLESFVIPTHDDDRKLPEGSAVAEIWLTPDEQFLVISSRWEGSINITNFDPSNSTMIASDPLINYSINQQDGTLTKIQEFPAGGSGPRQFSMNADGSLVAVGLQADGRVVVISRDVETGMLKDIIAHANIEGEVTAAIFYDDYGKERDVPL